MGKNGSALPGLIIERLSPNFLSSSLRSVEKKIILVTGTNGKTTTTKMLVAGLRGTDAYVVTNSTGSNMTRGLIAALVEDMTYFGSIKPTDWFVFEMDEAYAPIFTAKLSPRLVLGLNILRDQLDRYGEIDKTAKLIENAAGKADIFVYNKLDPLLSSSAKRLEEKGVDVSSFGISANLNKFVANEQTVHGEALKKSADSATTLASIAETENEQQLTIEAGDYEQLQVSIPVKGFHNALNAVAVTGVLIQLAHVKITEATRAIADMPIPFGRGEKLHLRQKVVTVALVKNPSGFASNLKTFVQQDNPDAVLFVVNDRFADGRDVSWLWDVDFKNLLPPGIPLFVAGIRAYDMAVRLKQDGFEVNVEPQVSKVMQYLMKSDFTNITVIPTYTALFEVRSALGKYGRVPRIW